MVQEAAKCGSDFVKFQCHLARYESSNLEKFRVNFSDQDASRFAYWERTAFTNDEWRHLIDFCEKLNIKFMVSVFSTQAAKLMSDFGVQYFKIGSGDLNNFELVEYFSMNTCNLFVSTGMAKFYEIENVVQMCENLIRKKIFTLMQCTSLYPTPLEKVGLNFMKELKERFNVPVGLSDHSEGISAAIAAISMNADFVEKHVIYHKGQFGPDVKSSVTFDELKQIIDFRNDFELMKQNYNKDEIADELQDLRRVFGRSLGLISDFQSGHVLGREDFCLRKPFGGFTWADRLNFIGIELKNDYLTDQLLNESHLGQ
jgi:N,N'-diacetyllegionaminate synthase